MQNLKIAIGCDHAGFDLKEKMKKYLKDKVSELKDFGTYSSERADYPDFAHQVATAVENKTAEYGILICGSGNGVNITANKHKGVRSALCWTAEIAELARLHNNANVVAIPARFISEEEAFKIADKFLNTSFEGGRHTERVAKIEMC